MTDVVTRDDFLSFDGVRIGWHELGHGRPLLLLHGLFSSGDMNWRRYGAAAEIAGAGHRVIMPDFRAHGVSAAPHDAVAYPPDVLAMDIEALVKHLGIDDFDLGGYSLGARTAMRLLVRGMQPGRAILSGMGLAGLTGGTDRAAWFLNVIANADSFASGTAEYAAAAFMKANNIDGAAVAHVLRSQVSTPADAIAAVATRTLVLCGVDDRDNGAAAELAMTLPNAALVEIPGNHMSAVTKPDFGTAIAAWLAHA
ncbi:pimeloyl-ACP methyl ester carboxylesterase [Polymorphobacter fuscus]|uniref:alpha/beta fold hydrolase n=1 Tax=Sandarakinorhabdus fusca TaxID=1439888 RepID=UPI00143176C0|nr:alpha/beta fold hydrolase [Polymorphobacter fuscus]NJC09065.1 pimeloyl-ACP methyl ester carboxylesterase [Polymorphobacter fuscus]